MLRQLKCLINRSSNWEEFGICGANSFHNSSRYSYVSSPSVIRTESRCRVFGEPWVFSWSHQIEDQSFDAYEKHHPSRWRTALQISIALSRPMLRRRACRIAKWRVSIQQHASIPTTPHINPTYHAVVARASTSSSHFSFEDFSARSLGIYRLQ